VSADLRVGGLLATLLAVSVARADGVEPDAIDRFTATTVSMTPADLTLRIDVRQWSDEASRTAVVDALEAADAQAALRALPTLGYVWRSGSGVGYAVKYAHRLSTADGERVTFVTDKRLGAYDLKPWTAGVEAAGPEIPYSVVELYLGGDGSGVGTLSLVAPIVIDAANAVVSLAADSGTPRVLANVKLEPKPYWARGPGGP
jgi:hypothetical protein